MGSLDSSNPFPNPNRWDRRIQLDNMVHCVTASSIKAQKRIELIKGIMECGEINVICGAPATGKSTLLAEIISIITNGGNPEPWPVYELDRPYKVLVVSDEDSIEKTTVGRLAAANANRNHVNFVSEVRKDGRIGEVNLATDLEQFANTLEDIQIMVLWLLTR